MKALKYGLTLILGLSMLGGNALLAAEPSQEQRGMPMPKNVEDLLMKGDYSQAATEFENFVVKAKTKSCDLIYLACMFYDRLSWMDEANGLVYKQKKASYINEFQNTCGNTVDAYVMKNQEMEPKNLDSTVVWMTKAIAVDSTQGYLYTMRGSALLQLGRTKEACADLKKAMETDNVASEMYNMQCANFSEESVDTIEEEAATETTEPAPAE